MDVVDSGDIRNQRREDFNLQSLTVYAWAAVHSVFGLGKLAGPAGPASYGGINIFEMGAASVGTGQLVGSGAGTGAVTAAKTNIVNLGDITIALGTVQPGLFQTAPTGQRVLIDATNGFRGFDGSSNLVTQIATDGSITSTGMVGNTLIGGLNLAGDAGSGSRIFIPNSGGTILLYVGSSQRLTISTSAITALGGAVFTGDGSGLTTLNASNLSSGTVADARLTSNVVLKNATSNISGKLDFNAGGGQCVPRHFANLAAFKAAVAANEVVTFADSGVFYFGSFDSVNYYAAAAAVV
jgi:hypothetical protein